MLFRSDSTGLEGQIRVSVAPGFATRYLVPMLARFSEHYPNITFEIQVGMGAADLKKQKTDVAIITGNPEDPKLMTLPRGRNIYLPLASPAYIRRTACRLNPRISLTTPCSSIQAPSVSRREL